MKSNVGISDHANDYCSLSADEDQNPKLWMCYGGGTGFGGYGGYDNYIRRMRFFDFDMNEGSIVTYKRLEYNETEIQVDRQVIFKGGNVMAPTME